MSQLKNHGPGGCCCGCVPRFIVISPPDLVAEEGWTIEDGEATADAWTVDQHLTWLPDSPSNNGLVTWVISAASQQKFRLAWQWLDHDNYRWVEVYFPTTPADVVTLTIGETISGTDSTANTITWDLGRYTGSPVRPTPPYTCTLEWGPTSVSMRIVGMCEFAWPNFSELTRDGRVGFIATDTQSSEMTVTSLHTYCTGAPHVCGCLDDFGPLQFQVDVEHIGAMWGLPNVDGTWVLSHTYFKDLTVPGRDYCLYRYVDPYLTMELWHNELRNFPTPVGQWLTWAAYATTVSGRPGDPYWDTALLYGKRMDDIAALGLDCADYDHLQLSTAIIGPSWGVVKVTKLPV